MEPWVLWLSVGKNRPILLQNRPKDDPKFNLFWQIPPFTDVLCPFLVLQKKKKTSTDVFPSFLK